MTIAPIFMQRLLSAGLPSRTSYPNLSRLNGCRLPPNHDRREDQLVSERGSRTAIVMAAGKGIGEGIARYLAGIGYKLLLVSNGDGAARLASELGCLSFRGSAARKADIDAVVALALANWDRIDLVVNNTGHPARGELLEITDQNWHDGLDLLLLNVVRMAQAVTPVMQRQGGGAIVNISTY